MTLQSDNPTIGFIGLGKLGMPVAECFAELGYTVNGHDLFPKTSELVNVRPTIEEAMGGRETRIIFVAVQTPHAPHLDGTHPDIEKGADFDYEYLERALHEIDMRLMQIKQHRIVAVISTVSPGTIRHLSENLAGPYMHLVYNPAFIAMGSVKEDFVNPEFVLIGEGEEAYGAELYDFYTGFLFRVENRYVNGRSPSILRFSYESAEITKMTYNTFIGLKILFANDVMRLCHEMAHADSDDVSIALSLATERVASAKYLYGGMADGGACHPRDALVMKHLTRKWEESSVFQTVAEQRIKQMEWICRLAVEAMQDVGKGSWRRFIMFVGVTYKTGVTLRDGSAADLCMNILHKHLPGLTVRWTDPLLNPEHWQDEINRDDAGVFVIGTPHEELKQAKFPAGSVVLDPFRMLPPQRDVSIRYVGVGPR